MPELIDDVLYLNKDEVRKRYVLKSGRTIEMWVKEGRFPKPMKPSYKTALWSKADLDAHDAKIKAGEKPSYETPQQRR